jgi:PAS domain S-box-containing protein
MPNTTSIAAGPMDQKAHVLLVDDQPESLLALETILTDLGAILLKARSGEEALRYLPDQNCALILLDLQMPGPDGFETAQRIWATDGSRNTPIIFLSSEQGGDLATKAYTLGGVDYLVKPVRPEVLRAKVAGLLQLFQEKQTAKRQHEQLHLLIDGTKDYALFMLDPRGYILTWNAGAERIKGYRAEEIIGQHFSRFYTAEDARTGKPQRGLEIAAGQGKFEAEGWRVRKDGTLFWANVLITALHDQAGNLRGFSKVTRDLTERRGAEENARRLLQEQAARQAAEESAQAAERAERAERRQREQLHVTLRSIGDGVIVTDTAGIVTFLNPVAQVLTGWSPKEAAGQPLGRVFHIVNEESRNTVENPVTKALRDGTVVGLANHTLLIARDGTERPIDDSAAPIRGEDGAVAGVVLVFRDVTEARQALEARLRLAAIVESSDDAIISKNLDGIIVSWNQGAERLYGYTAEEVVGRPLTLLVPPDHPDELPAIMDRLKGGERIEHFETVRLRKDGSRVDVSLTISPVKNAEGKIIGASKVARDITASKRKAEAARFLADASRLLAEVMDVSSTLQKVARLAVPYFADWCAVDLLEPDGSLRRLAVAHVNPAKVQLAHELQRRYPPDPKAPYGVWHMLRTGQSELVAEINDAMIRESIKDEERLRIIGDLGLKSYIGVPLRVRGKTLGVLTFIAAESGRRYDAADLALAENLADRAGIAIENARLYGELREADRHKDEFLAMLAHELRNPLAPICNSLHIMKQAALGPEMAGRVRDIAERQVQHMARLLDDLLDVARISRGRIALRQEVVDMASVVQRTVEAARPLLEGRHHQVTVSLPPEPVRVRGDAARLEQVLTNLLNNSAKYTDPGGHISLTVQREGGEAVLRVRDTGIGIAPEMLPRIFDLFVQAERRLDRSQGGVGIGLTLVKKLVELHGGTIQAFSPGLGKGSEFVVRLPHFSGERGHGTRRGEDGEGVRAAPPRHRVLVVDDNVDAADSLAILLRLKGQDVRVAHDGVAALETAGEFRPTIVFLDIGMPGMDGYEVCQRLRHQSGKDSPLIVALTGWGQEEDRRRSQEAGFDLHFIKPVEPDALHKLLEDPGSARKRFR